MLLLDTHAIIWLVLEEPMAPAARVGIERAAATGSVLVSPVSAWEVGLLATRRRQPLAFRPDPVTWFERPTVAARHSTHFAAASGRRERGLPAGPACTAIRPIGC